MSVVVRAGFANALWEAAMSAKPDSHEKHKLDPNEHPPAADLGVNPHGEHPTPLPPLDVPPHGGDRAYAGWDDEPTAKQE